MNISNDLKKNNVPAVGQLQESDCVSFHLVDNTDIRILFLGNSITRHGKAENLGWYGDWGMAASCRESDYVHMLVDLFQKDGNRVSYCIANLSEWERTCDMSLLETRYAQAKEFGADIVVVRLGENASLAKHLQEFLPRYQMLAEWFSENGAQVVITDLFWAYEPFDNFVENLAESKGYAFAQLHDLGASDKMKAIGKFKHQGVAVHPGDKGMKAIAKRIYRALKQERYHR